MRELFDEVNDDAVCDEMLAYRQMRTAVPLSRAADIEMALFGISMKAWPFANV